MSQGQPLLNYDVMIEICGRLPRIRDVLSFSLICRDLRLAAVSHLLHSRPVTVSLGPAIFRFYSFLSAGPITHSRFQLLRDLTIINEIRGCLDYIVEGGEDETPGLYVLLDILSRTNALKAFHFHRRKPYGVWDAVEGALPSLTSLEELGIHGLRIPWRHPSAIPKVDDMKIPGSVRRLYLDCPLGESWSNLYSLLHRLAPRLETLEISMQARVPWPSHHPTLRFPHLHSLSIECINSSYSRDTLLEVLLDMFPSVCTRLSLKCSNDTPSQNSENIRAASQRLQNKRDAWSHLDVFEADVSMLYNLALLSAVDRLAIRGIYSSRHKQKLEAALLDMHMTNLSMSISVPEGLCVLDNCFTVARQAKRITHLALRFYYHTFDLSELRSSMLKRRHLNIYYLTPIMVSKPTNLKSMS